MAAMITISTTAVPDFVRGALSRWLIEPAPGLYVGTVSANVPDELRNAGASTVADGAAILIHPDQNEQGFTIRTAGVRRRQVVDLDGLQLIAFKAEELQELP